MRSNLELLPVINVKSRPRYISALKNGVPDISRPKKYNFIKLLCNWHVKSSAIYTPNAYEVICRVARMAE
jgi:hypothetical protein